MKSRAALSCAGAVLLAVVSACNGAETPGPVQQPPTPLPAVSPPGHMYVEYGTAAGHELVQYRLPVTAASTPQAVLQQDSFINANPYAVDPSSGRLAIAPSADNPSDGLRIYEPPLVPGQSPAAVIPPGPATLPSGGTAAAFDPLGNLWLSTQTDIREFPLPFTDTEVATTIQSNYTFANIEVGSDGALYGVGNPLNVFSPLDAPVTYAYTKPAKKINSQAQLQSALAFDQSSDAIAAYQIVATGPTPLPSPFPVPTAGLGVFPLPIRATELPSLTVPLPGNGSIQPSLDGSVGTDQSNLYVGDSVTGTIYVYPLPIQNAAPAFALRCPASIPGCVLPTANLPNAVFQFGP